MSIRLSDAEVADITGRVKWPAQRRMLDSLGYKYDLRKDGKPIVLKCYLEARARGEKYITPDWDALKPLILVGRAGFEPATNWLKANRPTGLKALCSKRFKERACPQKKARAQF